MSFLFHSEETGVLEGLCSSLGRWWCWGSSATSNLWGLPWGREAGGDSREPGGPGRWEGVWNRGCPAGEIPYIHTSVGSKNPAIKQNQKVWLGGFLKHHWPGIDSSRVGEGGLWRMVLKHHQSSALCLGSRTSLCLLHCLPTWPL